MSDVTIPADISKVEPGYKHSMRLQAIIFWIFPFIGSLVLNRFVLMDTWAAGIVPTVIGVLALASIIFAPAKVYKRLGYALDSRLLRVVRGWLFHTDTIVPFVRVQHIDVTRGPLDKIFGTAVLVVHTAGTHNSVVTLPGLAPDRALEIRDAIRAEIRADSE